MAEWNLSAHEVRALGCLIEKQATTPETYPLTVNAAHVAANQKTSRDPIMNLSMGDTHYALKQLVEKRLARHISSSRADRYEHLAETGLDVTRMQAIALAVLMLRGGQTASEILARSDRMHRFADLDEVEHQLERLVTKGLAVILPRRSGQRGERYMHLLSGTPVISDEPYVAAEVAAPNSRSELEERVTKLEEQVAALMNQLHASNDESANND